MKLLHTEVKFYPEAKFQTGLSSLRVSCECALSVAQSSHNLYFRHVRLNLLKEGHSIMVQSPDGLLELQERV